MKVKIFSVAMSLLVLYAVLHLIVIRKDNLKEVDRQNVVIQQELRKNEAERLDLQKKKSEIERSLSKIPKTIKEGFADPERQFVEFMDYINASDLKKMHGSLAITQMQTFKESPVPLQETRFEIQFTIESTRQLESFLEYLLKGKYPLNVQQLEIKRIPQQLPHVLLKVALLLPAKIDLPQSALTGKEAS
jgi:hypothetical protein